jgi:hypothetical protein
MPVERYGGFDVVGFGQTCGETNQMSFVHLQPAVALIAGILILLIPRLLNFIVAIYLIIIGVTGLWPNLLR